MPNYDYKCQKCGGTFEVWQKITEQPVTDCPVNGCGGKVERLINPAGFILKGSGWYATDYKKSPGNATESASPKETKTTNETKSDTKPKAAESST